ncbi:hypothetical protein CQW23_30770 [Capsicum baccatum]|uniref:Uncharacterized protein n=1 Tax=Capsicum baccatum TaxID=33114 RepID=A0A2G2V9Q0_CAPBA|nr:hypothetical protein CQW23_30770 [Capsicum baccatum]
MVHEQVQLKPINSGNNDKGRTFVGVPDGGIILHSRQEYLGGDNVIENSLSAVVNNNNVVGEYVEREKRTPKENSYYKNAVFVLKKDGLPSEINRKLKTKGGGKKDSGVSNHGFAFDDNYRKQLYRSCTEQAFEVEFGPRSILC